MHIYEKSVKKTKQLISKYFSLVNFQLKIIFGPPQFFF